MDIMVLHGFRDNKDVIQIDKHKLVNHVTENVRTWKTAGASVSPKDFTRYC